MSGFRLKEYLNPMRSRQSKISSQVKQNPLGLTPFTLTVKGITVLLPAYNIYHNSSIIQIELWRDTVPLERNCTILPHSVFLYGLEISITIFHTSDDVVCRRKKKQTQNLPPPPPDKSTTLPTTPLIGRFSYKNRPNLSVFEFHLKCTRNS